MKNKHNLTSFDAGELEGSIDDAIAYLQRVKSVHGFINFELVYEPPEDDIEYNTNFGHRGKFKVFAIKKR